VITDEFGAMLDDVRKRLDALPEYAAYAERHGIRSAALLTVTDAEVAAAITERIGDRIRGKVVVEIGGGIGLLSIFMGSVAKTVFCIEANPVWAAAFTELLISMKPNNVSYLLGSADQFVGIIKADVAVLCTHSGVGPMMALGHQLAGEVIDVHGEMIEANPEKYDAVAVCGLSRNLCGVHRSERGGHHPQRPRRQEG